MKKFVLTTLMALGFVGAGAVGDPSPTKAQGVYLEGPGVAFGAGRPGYRARHYGGYRSYATPFGYDGPRYYSRGDAWDRLRERNRAPSWE